MEDIINDPEKLQKMIALGIYDEEQVERMKRMNESSKSGPKPQQRPAERPPDRSLDRPPPRPAERPADRAFNQIMNRSEGFGQQMNRGFRGGPRGQPPRGGNRGGGRGRGWNPNQESRFNPLPNSVLKWKELDEVDEFQAKRSRPGISSGDGPEQFPSTFRDSIRDGIQHKIERNEIERKLNIDYMKTSGNSLDSDLRVTNADSRKRDTDLRGNTSNQRNIAFTADEDMRGGAGDVPRGQPYNRPYTQAIDSYPPQKRHLDEVEDFIMNASMKLGGSEMGRGRGGSHRGERGGGYGRGRERPPPSSRGGPSRPPGPLTSQSHPQRPYPSHSLSSDSFIARPDDPLGLRQPSDPYSRYDEEEIMEVPREEEEASKDIAILKETVDELAKSNLYCQYCNTNLSSLLEVNKHIASLDHQRNMHMKTQEEQNQIKAQQQQAPPPRVSQTIVERVPVGMAAIVQMIEQKKQITLKSLMDMDSYDISSDSEAALAKELATLLTRELLTYKMKLVPDQVKQAMKDHGIGILNSLMNTMDA